MPNPKVWKYNDPKAPAFPDQYEVIKKATLQKTDLSVNNNKYYGLELHKASGAFRVFTHYGRTEDIAQNAGAGVKECRYFTNLLDAEREYQRLYRAKTGSRKGYVELFLASSNIGSVKGMSSGHIDAKTAAKTETPSKKALAPLALCPSGVDDLISLIYNEATSALTSTVQAKITAKGIETPLGVLTVGQIERGEQVLKEVFDAIQASVGAKELEKLSSKFYTVIPHKLGRTKEAVAASVINSKAQVSTKEETLQLMRDMLTVDGAEHNVLVSDHLGEKYKALGCEIEHTSVQSSFHKEWADYTLKSLVKGRRVKVQNVYRVKRPGEETKFNKDVGNIKFLFHGSRIKNWVGLLTRGTLMPKLVVAMGGNRTDGGWLGNGIYFGDAACTSVYYTSPGRSGRRLMSIHSVALGKMAEYKKITYGMNEPPAGFNSCHGDPKGSGSQFQDDEFCIYNEHQQMMQVLVEFTT